MKMQRRRPAKARIKENAFSTMTLQLYYSVPILSPVNFVTAIWFILCNWTALQEKREKKRGGGGGEESGPLICGGAAVRLNFVEPFERNAKIRAKDTDISVFE